LRIQAKEGSRNNSFLKTYLPLATKKTTSTGILAMEELTAAVHFLLRGNGEG